MFNIIFCFLLSLACLSSAAVLTLERRLELQSIYSNACAAAEAFDDASFESIIRTRAADLREALDYDIAFRSLLYMTLFECGISLDKFRLFAEYGIEVGGTKAFKRDFYCWRQSCPVMAWLPLDLYQALVYSGLVLLEDLWIIAIDLYDSALFGWLCMSGANTEYRIPFSDHGEYESVLGRCLSRGNESFLLQLLEIGVDVNAPPCNEFINLWQMVSVLNNAELIEVLPAIADATEDLFAPFYDTRFGTCSFHAEIDSALSFQLRRRKNALAFAQQPTIHGWTLLDRISLAVPGKYRLTAYLLKEAGLPENFPLTNAYYLENFSGLEDLILSGSVDYNEQAFPGKTILSILIENGWYDSQLIEVMIDRGAEVNYPPGCKYSNAYLSAFEERDRQFISQRFAFSESLKEKIRLKLNPQEAEKVRIRLENYYAITKEIDEIIAKFNLFRHK